MLITKCVIISVLPISNSISTTMIIKVIKFSLYYFYALLDDVSNIVSLANFIIMFLISMPISLMILADL